MIKSPIIVKDRCSNVLNPREEYYHSTKKKILGKKGIFLKDFITNSRKVHMDNSYSEEKDEEMELRKEKEREKNLDMDKERDKGKLN
jgi:predicted nucleic acid-binding protein